MYPTIEIEEKSKLRQLLCRHQYEEGIVWRSKLRFLNIRGTTLTTICVKCGKKKGTRFVLD